jgi:methionine--tRNA ligase beta chain
MDTINITDFQKIDVRVGKVIKATEVEGSEKLIRQEVDFGLEIGTRVIFSGIKKWYKPEDIEGKMFTYVVNLEPRRMPSYIETPEGKKQEESQGMLMACMTSDGSAVLLSPITDVEPGTKIV